MQFFIFSFRSPLSRLFGTILTTVIFIQFHACTAIFFYPDKTIQYIKQTNLLHFDILMCFIVYTYIHIQNSYKCIFHSKKAMKWQINEFFVKIAGFHSFIFKLNTIIAVHKHTKLQGFISVRCLNYLFI